MNPDRIRARSPLFVTAVGALLLVTAVVHHSREITAVGGAAGPTLALVLDGVPALVLSYAGYRLSRTDLPPQEMWTAVVWSLAGTVLLLAVMGATFVVRVFEGRPLVEPIFPLLVAAAAGGIAGLMTGYYSARARTDARRSRTVTNALAFINDLIRHDLLNDLSVIKGHAGQLADAPEDSGGDPELILEKTDEALSRIETSRVITDTLVGDPDLEPTDLVPVVTEMAARTDDTFFGVTVTTDLPETAVVNANDGIRSVVDNLLENAVEHNDADDPRVEAAVTVAGDVVRFTVTDNGPGIPDDLKESLFEPAEDGSSGGLSLVYTLVSGYGGEVRVEDVDPHGAQFVATLPRAENRSEA